jgi:capsular exopolysaccharide synthesis family protein
MENIQDNFTFKDDEQSSFNFTEWVMRFVGYWYLFIFGVVIALAIAYYQNRSWQATYFSEARILLQENQSSYSFIQGFSGGQRGNSLNSENQQIFLKSFDLVGKTVDSLPEFKIDYYTQGRFIKRSLYKNSPIKIEIISLVNNAYAQNYIFSEKSDTVFTISVLNGKNIVETIEGKYNEPVGYENFLIKIFRHQGDFGKIKDIRFRFRSRESLLSEFESRLSVYAIEKTSVVCLALTSSDIKRDNDFLNKHLEIFLTDNLDRKNSEAIRTINFINEQIDYLSDSLSRSEANLRSFKMANNIVDYESYAGNLPARMADIEQKGKELAVRDAYFSYLKDYLTKNIETGSIMSPTSIGITETSLLGLVSQYNKLQMERIEIGKKNPKYEILTTQMAQVKQYLFELMNSVDSVFAIDRATYKRETAEIDKIFREAPDKERRLLDYERKFKINDSYYTFLLQKRSEAQMRKAANASDNQIIQQARVMLMTNGKDKKDKYTTFLMLGILIPVIFIVLKELLNFSIKNEKDIEKASPFTLIGSVKHTKHRTDERVIAAKYPNSAFVEALRVIRTKLEIILQRREKFMIMISSTESGDGKTYVSANLAATFALQKKPTLLLDFDLRKPNLTSLVNSQNKKLGFVNYLIGDATLEEVIERKEEYGFDFISSGIIPPNPGEFVRSSKLLDFFDKLRSMYDFIIIDTSPLGLVADAYAIIPIVDASLLIVRSMKTNKTDFRDLVRHLYSDGAKNIYVVLNDVENQKLGYGYTSGYSYGGRKKGGANYYATEYFEEGEQSMYERFIKNIKSIFKK